MEILNAYPELCGIYITCGGVSEVGRALKESGREKEVAVVSFENYPEILQLMREGVINCTLASDFQRQRMLPVKLIMDYLVFGLKPERDQMFTEFRVLVKGCRDIHFSNFDNTNLFQNIFSSSSLYQSRRVCYGLLRLFFICKQSAQNVQRACFPKNRPSPDLFSFA